ncbi:hypothetical protein J2129_002210 [Methanofollis sp. W23]|nr:hypothetical protein [Methanofollis sp. W23]
MISFLLSGLGLFLGTVGHCVLAVLSTLLMPLLIEVSLDLIIWIYGMYDG